MNRIINLTSHEPFNAILIQHTKQKLHQLFNTFPAYRSLIGSSPLGIKCKNGKKTIS